MWHAQVDLASSLAVLLGVPIPFGNIGRVSPELLALAEFADPRKAYLEALGANAQQVEIEAIYSPMKCTTILPS